MNSKPSELYPNSRSTLEAICLKFTCWWALPSPAITIFLELTKTSPANLVFLMPIFWIKASKILSDIRSEILSGWPLPTPSQE
ncbi:hypothetical protein PRV_02790 [Mycoplasma parvum str. Indiana]|uniref:Uncharacterized protein n=1 Tax=Mycoplasma parvum str. Indiana TaxID=1403316 RepID=U5NGF2_9MOLU|nr:hypothetical protein PRV_02790 [Mycoplasma parvum str. Indiana]